MLSHALEVKIIKQHLSDLNLNVWNTDTPS